MCCYFCTSRCAFLQCSSHRNIVSISAISHLQMYGVRKILALLYDRFLFFTYVSIFSNLCITNKVDIRVETKMHFSVFAKMGRFSQNFTKFRFAKIFCFLENFCENLVYFSRKFSRKRKTPIFAKIFAKILSIFRANFRENEKR
jgi:hypothetical protein